MSVTDMDDWTLLAKCHGMQDVFFKDGSEQKAVRMICQACEVRPNCLAEALDNRIDKGVWGGMTERERRQLLRQHSEVTSWHALLCRPEEVSRRI